MEPTTRQPLTLFEQEVASALDAQPRNRTAACPPPETLLALARQQFSESQTKPILAHITFCAACRQDYATMQRSREQAQTLRNSARVLAIEPTSSVSAFLRWVVGWPSLAFSGAVIAGVFLFYLFGLRPKQEYERKRYRALVAQEVNLRREAASHQLDQTEAARQILQRDQRIKTLQAQLNTTQRKAVQNLAPTQLARLDEVRYSYRVAQNGRFEVPSSLDALARGVLQSGGSAAPAAIRLVRPNATAIADPRPLLQIAPASGVTVQGVVVMDDRGNLLQAERQSPSRWRMKTPLPPGDYSWQAQATSGAKSLTARFRVLGASERQDMARIRRQYSAMPLLLAPLAVRYGLLDEAEEELKRARNSPQAIALLRDLQSRRQQLSK